MKSDLPQPGHWLQLTWRVRWQVGHGPASAINLSFLGEEREKEHVFIRMNEDMNYSTVKKIIVNFSLQF